MLRPNCAPACEYVAMPLGSSSAAPVIKPGPSVLRNFGLSRRSVSDVFDFGVSLGLSVDKIGPGADLQENNAGAGNPRPTSRSWQQESSGAHFPCRMM